MDPRVPPSDRQAEDGVIGAMMSGGAAVIEEMKALLTDDAFFYPANRVLFGGIVGLQTSGTPADPITLSSALKDAGMLDIVGGDPAVFAMFTLVPSGGAHALYYAEIVREKWMLRQIIDKCSAGIRAAYEEQQDPMGTLEKLQNDVIEIGQLAKIEETIQLIGKAVDGVVAQIESVYHNRGKILGISTGFVDLDRITGGWQAPKTYYIGARPAMGKTSLALEFAEHAAIEALEKNIPVGFFSVEMTRHELAEVIICRRAGVDLIKLRDGMMTKAGHAEVLAQAELLKQAPIHVDETGNLTIMEFRARARRMVMKLGCKLLFIDYVQRMRSPTKRAAGNREQEINEIAQGISETAKELRVPIVVLAQLNRNVEGRSDRTPELSDLRESGSLEQEAHFVGLLHRPVYYAKSDAKLRAEAEKREMSEETFKQLAELIVVKQRRGPVGTINLRFIKQLAAFESEDPDRPLFSNDPERRQQT